MSGIPPPAHAHTWPFPLPCKLDDMSQRYFVEIQPRIQTMHVTLSGNFSQVLFSCTSVSFTDRELENEQGREARKMICNWASPKLIFHHTAAVNMVPSEVLSFRFKTQRDGPGEHFLCEAFQSTQEDELPVASGVVVRCGFCSATITKKDV